MDLVRKKTSKRDIPDVGAGSLHPLNPGDKKLGASHHNKDIAIAKPRAERREGEPEIQEKGATQDKKGAKPSRKKKRPHVPSPNSMIPGYNDKKPPGTPADGGALLFAYKGSWAQTIYCTENHTNAIRLLKPVSSVSKMKLWPLEMECARVRDLVKASGLLPAVDNSMIQHDNVAISAFVERYYGETDTFHLPCGEMTITPEDCEKTLKLSVTGKCVMEGYCPQLPWENLYDYTLKSLGWNKATTLKEMDKCVPDNKIQKFNLVSLRTQFQGTLELEKQRKLDDNRVTHTATAYLLYLLGCVIFPNSTGNKVDANLLQLLHPLSKVGDYAWGSACLAYLMEELRKASREKTAQIAGNVSLFQVWIYEHFPTIKRGKILKDWEKGMARGKRWSFSRAQAQSSNKEQELIDLRIHLDRIKASEVCFDPYRGEIEEGKLVRSELARYFGALWHPTGYVMYNSTRVLRQIGRIQKEPLYEWHGKYKVSLEDCTFDNESIMVVHDAAPTVQHWNERRKFCLPYSKPVTDGSIEVDKDYMKWYQGVSHLHVIRRDKGQLIATSVAPVAPEYTSIIKGSPPGFNRLKKRMKLLRKKMNACLSLGIPLSLEMQREHLDLVNNLDNEAYACQFGEKIPTSKGKRSRASTSTTSEQDVLHGDGDGDGDGGDGDGDGGNGGRGAGGSGRGGQPPKRGRGGRGHE